MSYRVHFSDRTQVTIDDEQGKKLMSVQASVKKPDYVNIADNQYRLSTVVKVVKVASEPSLAPQLQSGKSKAHDKSIHREIYYLFKKELTKPNPRKWEEFRQAAYDYLYSQDSEWCDDRKGTCVCEKQATTLNAQKDNVPVSTERVKEVMDMMRA